MVWRDITFPHVKQRTDQDAGIPHVGSKWINMHFRDLMIWSRIGSPEYRALLEKRTEGTALASLRRRLLHAFNDIPQLFPCASPNQSSPNHVHHSKGRWPFPWQCCFWMFTMGNRTNHFLSHCPSYSRRPVQSYFQHSTPSTKEPDTLMSNRADVPPSWTDATAQVDDILIDVAKRSTRIDQLCPAISVGSWQVARRWDWTSHFWDTA